MGGGVLKGGLAGTPLLLWSLYGPCRRRAENFSSLHPLGAKVAAANCWLSASNIGRGGGAGGSWGGHPLSSYGVRLF